MRILITAGGTREYIDPVRFISNASTGKMGYAIARAAAAGGHLVTLITAPAAIRPPDRVRVVNVVSAADMFKAVRDNSLPAIVYLAPPSPTTRQSERPGPS